LITIILVGGGMVTLSAVENHLVSEGKLEEAEKVKILGTIVMFVGTIIGVHQLLGVTEGFMKVMGL
jgi:hypothetical protein